MNEVGKSASHLLALFAFLVRFPDIDRILRIRKERRWKDRLKWTLLRQDLDPARSALV